jgi:hypothetical protein
MVASRGMGSRGMDSEDRESVTRIKRRADLPSAYRFLEVDAPLTWWWYAMYLISDR